MQIFLLVTFYNFFSFCVNEDKFPNIFKQTNITAAFKKGTEGPTRAIILWNILPPIEKFLSKQGTMFLNQVLSK